MSLDIKNGAVKRSIYQISPGESELTRIDGPDQGVTLVKQSTRWLLQFPDCSVVNIAGTCSNTNVTCLFSHDVQQPDAQVVFRPFEFGDGVSESNLSFVNAAAKLTSCAFIFTITTVQTDDLRTLVETYITSL